jgi:hypothetical protein
MVKLGNPEITWIYGVHIINRSPEITLPSVWHLLYPVDPESPFLGSLERREHLNWGPQVHLEIRCLVCFAWIVQQIFQICKSQIFNQCLAVVWNPTMYIPMIRLCTGPHQATLGRRLIPAANCRGKSFFRSHVVIIWFKVGSEKGVYPPRDNGHVNSQAQSLNHQK